MKITLTQIIAEGYTYHGMLRNILGGISLFYNPGTRRWSLFKNKQYDKKTDDYYYEQANINGLSYNDRKVIKAVCLAKELEMEKKL